MAELIDFKHAGTGLIARELVSATDILAETLREALLAQLREIQFCNMLDIEPAKQIEAIAAMRRVKALIAETYTDVYQRLAKISAETGRPVTDDIAAQVCRDLHPECFEVKLI